MASKLAARKSPRSDRAGTQVLMRDDVRAFKRELILNAAVDVFYEKGYQNSSVDDVAAAMSVTKTVIYYSCKSKEELLEGIIDRVISLSYTSIDRGMAHGKTPAEKLALLSMFYAEQTMVHRKMVWTYFREERNFSPALRRRRSLVGQHMIQQVTSVLSAGVATRDFRVIDVGLTALSILGMIALTFHWYEEEGRVSRIDICKHFAAQALRLAEFKGKIDLDNLSKGLMQG